MVRTRRRAIDAAVGRGGAGRGALGAGGRRAGYAVPDRRGGRRSRCDAAARPAGCRFPGAGLRGAGAGSDGPAEHRRCPAPDAPLDGQPHRRDRRHRLSPRPLRGAGLRRPESVAVRGDRQGRRCQAPRPGDPCRRLFLPRDGVPARPPRLRRQPSRRQLAGLARRFPRSGGAAAGRRAVGHGARQSRIVRPRRTGLVPAARSLSGPRRLRRQHVALPAHRSAASTFSCSTAPTPTTFWRRRRRLRSTPASSRRCWPTRRHGSWLLLHHPVWALGPPGPLAGFSTNQTMQAAIRGLVPPSLDLVLSGHVHAFISYDFGAERPAQLIVGTGGDKLQNLVQTRDRRRRTRRHDRSRRHRVSIGSATWCWTAIRRAAGAAFSTRRTTRCWRAARSPGAA